MLSSPQFQKQEIMLRVLYSLMPVAAAAIYFFGWCVVSIIAASMLFAFLTEWSMASLRKGKISCACFVTAGIYALSLPPTTPLWIVAVGAIIAILFAKEMFGGFGKNVFNPAIVGRAFVFVCFPRQIYTCIYRICRRIQPLEYGRFGTSSAIYCRNRTESC